MISATTNKLLTEVKARFKEEFSQKTLLENFIQEEQDWINKNLDYIYSRTAADVPLKIHPYCQFIELYPNEQEAAKKETYILMPKYLSMQQLYIQASLIDKADQMIVLMKNFGKQFSYNEITNALLGQYDPMKRDLLNKRLDTLVRKFLSYQYLVIS